MYFIEREIRWIIHGTLIFFIVQYVKEGCVERMCGIAKETKRKGLDSLRGLTFDDVLILPELTDIRPDQVALNSRILPGLNSGLPIWSAPMSTIWTTELTVALAECGAVGPIHRDLSLPELESAIASIRSTPIQCNGFFDRVTVGNRAPIIVATSPFDDEKISFLINQPDVDYIIFDTVQPYSPYVINSVERYSKMTPGKIIVGNVATAEAAEIFSQYDIAGIKVGLGPGSICTTRLVSGVGVPQLEAIQEVAASIGHKKLAIIADGGIRYLGDIAKALAAGATSVMLGNIFAGTTECAGDIIEINGVPHKKYEGSHYGSVEHQPTGINVIDEYFSQSNVRIEGASGLMKYKGSAKIILYQIKRALGASLAFVGAKTIDEFQLKARLIRVSACSSNENNYHDLTKVISCNPIVS